jgi:hypothetical protein
MGCMLVRKFISNFFIFSSLVIYSANSSFAIQEIVLRAHNGSVTAWRLFLLVSNDGQCTVRGTGPDMPNPDPQPVSDKECDVLKKLLKNVQYEFKTPKQKVPPILLVEEAQYELKQQNQSIQVELLQPEECVIDQLTKAKTCKKNVLRPSNWLLIVMKSKAEKMKKDRTYREVNQFLSR